MKCISCGAEIELTAEICPYCGRPVKETAGYRKDLNTYREKSEKTKRGLANVLKGNIPLIISSVILVALFIATSIAFYVKENAYHFRLDALRKESVRNYNEYSTQIKDYLDAGDYTGFAAFKEYHNIAEWEEPYDDLNLLCKMAYDYNRLVSEIESSVMFGPEPTRYSPEQDVRDCRSAIWEFYFDYDDKKEDIETDPYGAYIKDMKNKADTLLKVYLGVDETEVEAFLASSDIEQEAYLEGVIIDE